MNDRVSPAIAIIRLLVGWVFLVEGILKFLLADDLGVGRFSSIGIPAPQVMAPFVGAVHDVFRHQPQAFAPLYEALPTLITLLRQDRELLRSGKVPAREHFMRSIKKHAEYHKVPLPAGKEEEFARWVYRNPRRCPGLRLNHEVYRRLMCQRSVILWI